MIKKSFALAIAVILMMVTLTGCGEKSPTEVSRLYLDALKSQNFETAAQYYKGDMDVFDLEERDEIDFEDFSQENVKIVLDKMFGFEYSIDNERISGDTATVDVTITTYDFGMALQETIGEFFQKMLPLAFTTQPTEEETNAIAEKIFMEKIDTATFDYVETVPLTLTQEDDGWKVDEIEEDSAFLNAVLGGAVDVLLRLEDSFGSISEDD